MTGQPPENPESPGSKYPTEASGYRTVAVAESDELSTLMARVAQGDQHAFAALYDRTSARVFGVALRVLREPGFAEETSQEVFLQVWRSANTYDPTKGSPMSWIVTLAHRRAVDRVRAEQSNTDRQIAYEARNRTGEFDQVAATVLERTEQRAVAECLDTLTPVQRESVVLAYYGGHTYREVAELLGVAVPTVKSRIRDGLLRLKGCLGVG